MKKPYPKPQKFTPRNPKKYIGDVNNIVARSQLEVKYFLFCDMNDGIVKWNSEEIIVPYLSPIDNKVHRYFIDLYVETDKGNKFLVEIKPYSQTMTPKNSSKKRQSTLIKEAKTFAVNSAKWEAATAFAEKHNCKFIIMTERDIK